MVRRITIDEASANFKDIVERAMENGDSLELERGGRVIGTINPPLLLPKARKTLGEFLREVHESWPDEDFAKDIEEGMRWSRSQVVEDKWER